jgi:hypothetical protein
MASRQRSRAAYSRQSGAAGLSGVSWLPGQRAALVAHHVAAQSAFGNDVIPVAAGVSPHRESQSNVSDDGKRLVLAVIALARQALHKSPPEHRTWWVGKTRQPAR